MVMTIKPRLYLLLAIVCCCRASIAAPVSYDESIHGELPENGLLPVLAFDNGTNTIVGRFGRSPQDSDSDSFAFTIPLGSVLASSSVSLVDDDGQIHNAQWRLRSGSATFQLGTELEYFTCDSPGMFALQTLPRGSGLYNISHHTYSYEVPAPAHAFFTFTFNVVPEPSMIVMVFSAVAVSAGLCRRSPPAESVKTG